jgi:2-keto-3-deoxy-L-rhamnonate aldolase RhmA
MDYLTLSAMINAIHLGKSKVIVRVGGYTDRSGIQQSLDLGADGILVPYINSKKEAEEVFF